MANLKRAEKLAAGWFDDSVSKKEVSEILRRFDLDESAIEAEAIKLTSVQLEWLDRSLAVTSARLDKTLRLVMDYRSGFADRMRHHTKQALIEHVPEKEGEHGQPSPDCSKPS
jgi:hypothetical protein